MSSDETTTVERWERLYREATGLPPSEHQARRMEQLAAEWEKAKAETASLRAAVQAVPSSSDGDTDIEWLNRAFVLDAIDDPNADALSEVKADVWADCVGWFGHKPQQVMGPGHRVNINVLNAAEDANPYREGTGS